MSIKLGKYMLSWRWQSQFQGVYTCQLRHVWQKRQWSFCCYKFFAGFYY